MGIRLKVPVAILIFAVIVGAAYFFVAGFVPGGMVSISVDRFEYTAGKEWVAYVAVSGVGERILTNFKEINPDDKTIVTSEEKPDDYITIYLNSFKEYCTYSQGFLEEEINIPQIVWERGIWFDYDARRACHETVGGSPTEGEDWLIAGAGELWWGHWYCVKLIKTPVYRVKKEIDFEVDFTVDYKGEKAIVTVTENLDKVMLKAPDGRNVGYVEYVGSLGSLKATCSGKTPDLMTPTVDKAYFVPTSYASNIDRYWEKHHECLNIIKKSERIACFKSYLDKIAQEVAKIKQPIEGTWEDTKYLIANNVEVERPTFLIHLYTDWVKIYRPIGIPQIEWVRADESAESGERLEVQYKICNVGDGDTQFSISTTCDSGFVGAGDTTPLIKGGQCVEASTYIGAACGAKTTDATCKIKFIGPTPIDRGEIPSDEETFTTKCIAVTECTPNQRFCIGNDLYKCSSDGKSWELIEQCEKCVFEDNKYFCKEIGPAPVVEEDGIDMGIVLIVVGLLSMVAIGGGIAFWWWRR